MMKRLLVTLCAVLASACAPIAEITSIGSYQVNTEDLVYQPSPLAERDPRANVVFIASQSGTEIFDLLAPYEIFAQSGKYRLIVAAPERAVVPLWKGVGIVPHATLDELDRTPGFKADVIVVPNILDEENASVRKWLQANADQADYVLSVCEGMRVIGNAEIFKNAVVTTFSTTVDTLKDKYEGYQWVKDRRYVKSGRLISTAGVSAAAEGALALVAQMHGKAHAEAIRENVGYDFSLDDAGYTPQPHGLKDIWRILKKVTFSDNLDLGFLLRPGVSEMQLGAVLDAYTRTFPASLASVTDNDKPIMSRHGLKFVPKVALGDLQADQLHILGDTGEALPDSIEGRNIDIYRYDAHASYALTEVLAAIGKQYNQEFVEVVAKLLDYPLDRL